jgi:hypothetical protein
VPRARLPGKDPSNERSGCSSSPTKSPSAHTHRPRRGGAEMTKPDGPGPRRDRSTRSAGSAGGRQRSTQEGRSMVEIQIPGRKDEPTIGERPETELGLDIRVKDAPQRLGRAKPTRSSSPLRAALTCSWRSTVPDWPGTGLGPPVRRAAAPGDHPAADRTRDRHRGGQAGLSDPHRDME